MTALKKVERTLQVLHADASKDYQRIGQGMIRSIFRPIQPKDFKNAYLPVSAKQGEYLRNLIVKHNLKNVVEFGTSFGISTIYLGDGVRQTGGSVVTTELLQSKADRAKQNIEAAGLSDHVEFRVGDAMETLKDYSEPIDFLFLDGWKDLYLPLFQMLESNVHSGTIIYSDNMDMGGTKPLADYLNAKDDVYETHALEGGKAWVTRLR